MKKLDANLDSTKTKGMKMGNYNKVNSKGVIPEKCIG